MARADRMLHPSKVDRRGTNAPEGTGERDAGDRPRMQFHLGGAVKLAPLPPLFRSSYLRLGVDVNEFIGYLIMCWRGHDSERKRGKVCLDCHAIRMRLKRKGKSAKREPLYRLRMDWLWRKYGIRYARGLSEASGVSLNTIYDWMYVRGDGKSGLAKGASAKRLAEGLGVEMREIWERVR